MTDAPRPLRIRLSRAKGFDLQAHSRAINGLPAVNVARPSKWGNPFVIAPKTRPGVMFSGAAWGCVAVPSAEDAVAVFREMMEQEDNARGAELLADIHELRGKNLACWCELPKRGEPDICHAAVLLELSNMQICEPVEARG
jgi:hypothetical protein